MVKTTKEDRAITRRRTKLQQAATNLAFLQNWRLHKISTSDATQFPISDKTQELMSRRNLITEELKQSLKEDYEAYKTKILAARKQLVSKIKKDVDAEL